MKNILIAVSLFASAGADLGTTRYGINRGAYEANPVAGQGIKRQALLAFGSASAMLLIHHKMEKSHPKLAGTLVGAFLASRAVVSAHNVKVGNGRIDAQR